MEINFNGKRALVTGAGKGIGRCISKRLAELGAHVFAISRTQSDLDTLKEEVPSIETCLHDISDWDKTRSVVEQMGPIDLLVNNAGVNKNTSFLEVTKEELNYIDDINFKAAFNILQVVARGMVSRGTGGAIVNMSSLGSSLATPDFTAYACSKAAMDKMTSNTALELGPHKIRVNSINPGVVMTEMGRKAWDDPEKRKYIMQKTPLKDFVEESDVADATVFLLSDKAAMITGHCLPVEGGMKNVF